MSDSLLLLLFSAASVGFVHTVLGPDHYLPFVAMARAGRWSTRKTLIVTLLCGFGHVGSSVVLAFAGVALGISVSSLSGVEAFRADLAAWALIAFGLAYGVWGLRRAWRRQPHTHRHAHADGSIHTHEHAHPPGEIHVHGREPDRAAPSLTPWILFTVFVFGPCEPLIVLAIVPALEGQIAQAALITAVFGAVTIATMLAVVAAALAGVRLLDLQIMERYSHALAGLIVLACGVAIHLGL